MIAYLEITLTIVSFGGICRREINYNEQWAFFLCLLQCPAKCAAVLPLMKASIHDGCICLSIVLQIMQSCFGQCHFGVVHRSISIFAFCRPLPKRPSISPQNGTMLRLLCIAYNPLIDCLMLSLLDFWNDFFFGLITFSTWIQI